MYHTHLFFVFSTALFFLLLSSSTIHGFFASTWNENGHTIVLTNQNFDSQVKQHDVLLVLFYVKWCSHCRRMHPDYEQAATKLARDTAPPIHLAKLDCTDDAEAQCSRRYNIDGFPTLRIYRYGRFHGEELNSRNRTTDEIVKTMKALKSVSGQQEPTWFSSGQTAGVQDEVNQATAGRPSLWLLIGFAYGILQTYLL